MNRLLPAAAVFALAAGSAAAATPSLPTKVGQCVDTVISSVGTRLVDGRNDTPIPGSGSAVKFANGGYQVSYDTLPAITASGAGDKVTMCLVALPEGCPKGDERGKVYRTKNLRTGASWTLADSQHMCGGA